MKRNNRALSISGNIPKVGVQHHGASVGRGRCGRGRGRGGSGRRGGYAVAARAGRARSALARATPGARGPPGPPARRRGRPLGARRGRRAWPATGPPQALPLSLSARRATLPILPARGPSAGIPHAVRRRAYVPLSR